MSSSAQYAVTPKIGFGQVTTGDTSRTAPTAGNVAYVFPSGQNGSRIDHISLEGVGNTAASLVRLFLVPGNVGAVIASITFSGTTATVTTTTSHGLSTGTLITQQAAFPFNYNVTNVAITVTGLTTFTYTMASAPTINATAVGYYISTPAAPAYELWQEIVVPVITATPPTAAYSSNLSTAGQPSFMPLWLPAGWSLRATVNDTQIGINVFANGGDF